MIALRLEEYKALRAEMTQRLSTQWQMVGLAGAAAALVASGSMSFTTPNLYIATVMLAFALYLWRAGARMIRLVSGQLAKTERHLTSIPG